MLTKSKTTGKRSALGLAPSLMALSLAAFGVPAGALLVPSVALAVDCGPQGDDGVLDSLNCEYVSGGVTDITVVLTDPTIVSVLSSYVTTGGANFTGSDDIGEDVTFNVETDSPFPAPSITNNIDGDAAFQVVTNLDGQSVIFNLNNGTLQGDFVSGGAAAEGLLISTLGDDSDISVTTLDTTIVDSNYDDGIDLRTNGTGSDITVDVAGDITAGNNRGDVGIGAIVEVTGNIQINTRYTADILASGNGIEAQNVGGSTGNIDITVDGTLIDVDLNDNNDYTSNSDNQNGIYANIADGGTGNITINVNDYDNGLGTTREAVINAGLDDDVNGPDGINADNGILATQFGSGSIFIKSYADITAGGDGISAYLDDALSTGGITIEMHDTIIADNDGIQSISYGDGTVDIDAYGDITANTDADGYGIYSDMYGDGDTYIDVHRRSDILADEYGAYAWSDGSGVVDIDVDGDITAESANGAGIYAESSVNGTGDVEVTTGRRSVITGPGDGIVAIIGNASSDAELRIYARGDITSTTNDGIQTANAGSGDTDINVYGDITAGNSNNLSDAAIQANSTGSGDLYIDTGIRSDISGTGLGIEARTNLATGGYIDIDVDGDIDTNFMEFYVNSNSEGAEINIGEYSEINTDGDIITKSAQLVMDALGGATEVNNGGTIWGRVDLTGSADVFNNTSDNTWVFTGTSDFGPGSDVLNNEYDFDYDINGYILNAVDDDTAELAQFESLEQFNNEGDWSLEDTDYGDTFYRDRAYTTGALDSSGGGYYFVDASLSGLATSDSDRFIVGTTVTATGWLWVNDVDTGFGELDDLIPVIEVGDATGTGDFQLIFGPIDKGLYSYDLRMLTGGELAGLDLGADDGDLVGGDPGIEEVWALASYADASVNNLSAIPGIIAGNWNALAEGWQERSGDLRNYFMEPAGPLAYAPSDVILPTGETRDIGIWGRVVGLGGERTGSETIDVLNVPVTFDTGYQEQLVGGQAGIDFAFHLEDSTVVFGLMGAYAQSEVAFNSGDTASLTTPSIGAYADWIMGGTYFNALAKVDFIGLDYDYGVDSDTTTGLAIGGALEAGHRFDFDSLFIEPVARVSYVETDLDTFNIGPDEVDLYGSSFQAKAGGRVGGTFATETYTVAPYLSGYVGYEFLGESSADIDALPDVVSTDFSGAFAEIGAGVNVDDVDGSGLTGFADANVVVAEDYLGASASVGVRANF